MPIYEYKHPKTGEVFTDLRRISDRNKPYISEDGEKCLRVEVSSFSGGKGDKEVFELYREDVKKAKPKRIKFRDGHIEKYDPTKHC